MLRHFCPFWFLVSFGCCIMINNLMEILQICCTVQTVKKIARLLRVFTAVAVVATFVFVNSLRLETDYTCCIDCIGHSAITRLPTPYQSQCHSNQSYKEFPLLQYIWNLPGTGHAFWAQMNDAVYLAIYLTSWLNTIMDWKKKKWKNKLIANYCRCKVYRLITNYFSGGAIRKDIVGHRLRLMTVNFSKLMGMQCWCWRNIPFAFNLKTKHAHEIYYM